MVRVVSGCQSQDLDSVDLGPVDANGASDGNVALQRGARRDAEVETPRLSRQEARGTVSKVWRMSFVPSAGLPPVTMARLRWANLSEV